MLVLGEGQNWMGKAEDMLTPEILAQAYACHFSLQGGVLQAE